MEGHSAGPAFLYDELNNSCESSPTRLSLRVYGEEVAFVSPIDTGRLGSQIAGEVITPGHGEYEAARRVWNGMIDRRPAVIVRCMSAADVAASVGSPPTPG